MTDKLHSMWQEKRPGILCGIVIIALLVATLWPFNFLPPNRVSWLPEANGIRLGGDGLVVSKALLRAGGTETRKACSLEVLLRPANTESVHTEVARHYGDWIDERGLGPPDMDGAIAQYDFTESAGRDIHNAVVSGPDLEIPRRFEVPHKVLLKSPVSEFDANWDYVKDLLMNIAGFVPLGFVPCAYWGSM